MAPTNIARRVTRLARVLAAVLSLAWAHASRAFDRATAALAKACPWHRHPTPRVYKVYVFNEDDTDGDFYKAMPPYLLDLYDWEASVREHTGWENIRVEIRYRAVDARNQETQKYRMVLRPGERCMLLGADRIRRHGGIMSARLQGPKGSTIDTDVTSRVLKYQGPLRDFHGAQGLHVTVHDMFPFDDHADNAARFSHLRLVNARGHVVDLPYDSNPTVSELKRVPNSPPAGDSTCVSDPEPERDHTPGAAGTGSNGSSSPAPPEDVPASAGAEDAKVNARKATAAATVVRRNAEP